jgi:hypothetical protein
MSEQVAGAIGNIVQTMVEQYATNPDVVTSVFKVGINWGGKRHRYKQTLFMKMIATRVPQRMRNDVEVAWAASSLWCDDADEDLPFLEVETRIPYYGEVIAVRVLMADEEFVQLVIDHSTHPWKWFFIGGEAGLEMQDVTLTVTHLPTAATTPAMRPGMIGAGPAAASSSPASASPAAASAASSSPASAGHE